MIWSKQAMKTTKNHGQRKRMRNLGASEMRNTLIGIQFPSNYLKETQKGAIADTEDWKIMPNNPGKTLKIKSYWLW